MRSYFFLGFLLVLSLQCSYGQANGDTVVFEPTDTVQIKSYASEYDPEKALFYATVLPGLGQIYNKKYWKLPLVYGGFVWAGYGLSVYQEGYVKYKKQLFQNLELGVDVNPESGYSTDVLRSVVDEARRNRDLMIIVLAGVYILQIVDAHVDAHLKEFDVNPRLQVKIEPLLDNNAMTGRQTGLALVIRF